MRHAHALKHNLKSEQWKTYVFLDTETYEEEITLGHKMLTFRLAWACFYERHHNYEQWREFHSPLSLCQWIESHAKKKERLVVFTHNLFFDTKVSNFHTYFPTHGWTLDDCYFAESGLQCFYGFKKDHCSILFIDSLNFFPLPLRTLGLKLGLLKGTVDFESASEQELSIYCKRDTEILKQIILTFHHLIHSEDLGNPQRTIAAQAFSTFRHRFMPDPIYVHDTAPALALERFAYHGGRVECWRFGSFTGPIYKLDINSMYPYAMRSTLLPNKLLSYLPYAVTLSDLSALLSQYFVVAHVTLKTDQEAYPLAVRFHMDGTLDHVLTPEEMANPPTNIRIIYPHGTFQTALTSPLLTYALAQGHILHVHQLTYYQQSYVFKPFIEYFWHKRREAQQNKNEVYALIYKLLMNSLYGKMAQRRKNEVQRFTIPPDEYSSQLITYHGTLYQEIRFAGQGRWYERSQEESYHSFPAISAGVTDAARLYLWYLMITAGLENLYYIDTDSLFVNQTGYDNLTDHISPALGKLKLEDTINTLTIHAPKDYEHDGITKRKGIKANALYLEGINLYQQDHWEKFRGSLKAGHRDGYHVLSVFKQLKRQIKTRAPVSGDSTQALIIGQ